MSDFAAHLNPSLASRFWEKVDVVTIDTCWEWLGFKNQHGYGNFRICNRMVKAHRVAFALTKGNIPGSMCIRHSCDNPSCCNPAHLDLGTVKDNVSDMCTRGRRAILHGERNPNSKLTKELVIEIATSSEGQGTIAKRLGLSRSTICHIRSGRAWSSVTSHLPDKAKNRNTPTPMLDYTKLDRAICEHLMRSDGHPTNSSKLCEIAADITVGSPWRCIDRRLRAMRDNGIITFNRKSSPRKHGWVVNDRAERGDA